MAEIYSKDSEGLKGPPEADLLRLGTDDLVALLQGQRVMVQGMDLTVSIRHVDMTLAKLKEFFWPDHINPRDPASDPGPEPISMHELKQFLLDGFLDFKRPLASGVIISEQEVTAALSELMPALGAEGRGPHRFTAEREDAELLIDDDSHARSESRLDGLSAKTKRSIVFQAQSESGNNVYIFDTLEEVCGSAAADIEGAMERGHECEIRIYRVEREEVGVLRTGPAEGR